jgi:hypothetical protein
MPQAVATRRERITNATQNNRCDICTTSSTIYAIRQAFARPCTTLSVSVFFFSGRLMAMTATLALFIKDLLVIHLYRLPRLEFVSQHVANPHMVQHPEQQLTTLQTGKSRFMPWTEEESRKLHNSARANIDR